MGRMTRLWDVNYQPSAENKAIYDKLFAEYITLHDYFGRSENNVMKRLKDFRALKKERMLRE
jgi:L-ribulokinase